MSSEHPTQFRSQSVSLVPILGSTDAARVPAPLTAILGREREIAATTALLRDPAVRLVTLSGPGGVGKTRLALHLAVALAAEFADGVAFVELAAIREPNLVVPAIAQVIGSIRAANQPALTTLKTMLRDRSLLLVLDNFEHVGAAAPAVSDLLQSCPLLTALVTSRALLQLSGERAVPVPPLSLETSVESRETEHSALVSRLSSLDSDAVRLFVVRSQAVNPAFALTPQNADAVAEICARLDGLPLAIELAAARSALFPPTALLARLERRLPLLRDGPRDLPDRQRTMRDAVAWSDALLSPAEQAVFRRLAVFVGGFTLDAAEAVCAGTDGAAAPGAIDVVAIVESLTRQGLLQVASAAPGSDQGRTPRLSMLETVREFAAEELAARGDAEAARRHAAFVLALVKRAAPSFWGDAPDDGRSLIEPEFGNLRAALAWATEHGEIDIALQLAGACFDPHWLFDPQWLAGAAAHEQRDWTQRVLALPGGTPRHRVTALTCAACLAEAHDDYDAARTMAADALALARDCGDDRGLATASLLRGRSDFIQDDIPTARRWLNEALTGFRAVRAGGRAAWAHCFLASLDSRLAIDEGGDAAVLAHAASLCDEALATFRAVDYLPGIARALHGLAYAAYKQRELARSLALTQELLSLAQHHHHRIYHYLVDSADIAGRIGQPEAAARLYGAAQTEREHHEGWVQPVYHEEAERDMAVARRALGEAAFAASWATGQAMPIAQPVAEALALTVPPTDALDISLTPREREILPLLAEGKTDREIGDALFLSRRTVENYLARLRAKLGVRTRIEAIEAARISGLLPTPPEKHGVEGDGD